MVTFRQWLLIEERQLIDPAVLQSYEREFQHQLDALIQRSPAHLRPTFAAMKECPIRDSTGRCSSFTNYIVGALVRQGCTNKYDPEESLQRIAFHMLSPIGESGQKRRTLFDIDLTRDWDLERGNPLEARFKTYLHHDLAAICGGNIPRLAYIQRRPGTVSIGPARMTEPGSIRADQIPAKSTENWHELVGDILRLLRRQEREHPEIPLVDLFQSVLAGEQTRATRSSYGQRVSDMGRQIIIKTITNYAKATENRQLLRLLDRFKNFDGTKPSVQQSRFLPRQPKPQMSSDERDYRSIVAVMQQHGQRANLGILGKARRRWLEFKPRDPSSPHPNRLADVLARMVADGVVNQRGTRAGGRMFVPGPRYGEFVGAEELVGA
jgi:hypothetical protein